LLVLREFHLGLVGRLQVAFFDELLARLVELLLDNLGHHRFAIDAPEMRDRHLAGAESVDPGAARKLRELARQLAGESARRHHHHLELAFQTFAQRFGNLHHCDRYSNGLGGLVRAEGLEPPRVSPQEPKSCVSANFTTPAAPSKHPGLATRRSIAKQSGT